MKILTVVGTRPEAIKLAPVILALQSNPDVEHAICLSGQHREMLEPILQLFGLEPKFDLKVMRAGQGIDYITASVLLGMGDILREFEPDWVVVQGDTSTAFSAGLAAFYQKIDVAHVEAGLRTYNIYSPWPEEMNRKLLSQIAKAHFAPTDGAAQNLRREGIDPSQIVVTGNTVIDALQMVRDRLVGDRQLAEQCHSSFRYLSPSRKLILVTGHRRENLDGGLQGVCRAMSLISQRDDVEVVYPVHMSPRVREIVKEALADRQNIHLIEPLDYLNFVYLLEKAYLVVTDSGGIQEEAPGLGKPVLITRDTTERPEAVQAGTARLVGTDPATLVKAMTDLLDDPVQYHRMAQAQNPFGDGRAAQRIVDFLITHSATV